MHKKIWQGEVSEQIMKAADILSQSNPAAEANRKEALRSQLLSRRKNAEEKNGCGFGTCELCDEELDAAAGGAAEDSSGAGVMLK